MNRVDSHFENQTLVPTLSDIQTGITQKKYRVLNLNDDLTIYTTENQAENIFTVMDEKLHKKTYSDLQDEIFNLQDDFDELTKQNERLIEQAVGE